jgi:trigger factor
MDGDVVRLTVTVPASEVDVAIGEAYADIARKLTIPGFRKGKAPRPIIDQHVGQEAVLAEAAETLVTRWFPVAVEEHALLSTESADVGELPLAVAGEEFSFVADVPVRPEFAISQTDGFVVSAPAAVPTEAEIQAQIDYLRDRFSTLDVSDGPVAENDFALLSFVGKVDGEDYEGNSVDSYLYELGRGQMPPEFDQALIGANAGDEVKPSFVIPDTSSNPEFVGKSATFDVVVHEVKRKVLPEVDDEFAGNVGFDTIDELREDILTKLTSNKEAGRVMAIERAARDAVTAVLEGEVPPRLIDIRTADLFDEFFDGMKKRGVTPKEYFEATGASEADLRDDLQKQAAFLVREDLALEALARAHGIEVIEEDIALELDRMAEAVGRPADEVRNRLLRSGMLPSVREQLIHRKAVRWLMDNVDVTDETAQEVEES